MKALMNSLWNCYVEKARTSCEREEDDVWVWVLNDKDKMRGMAAPVYSSWGLVGHLLHRNEG